jgi:hypothetical protein
MKFIKLLFFTALLATSQVSLAKGVETGKSLGIFQSIALPEDGFLQSFSASLGRTKVTQEGAFVTTSDNKFNPTDTVTPIPKVGYYANNPMTQTQALSYAVMVQGAQVSILVNQVKELMQKRGAVEATYYYRQLIKVKGNSSTKAIIWHVLIDSMGKSRYSKPKIINEVPQFVHLTYTPKKIVNGLPSTWVYPNSGKYDWKIVDKILNPLSASTTVDVNGVYDEPVAQNRPYSTPYPSGCELEADSPFDMVCDTEWALKCLIDKTSDAACPATYKDVKDLIDETGSDGAYVDYVRALSPVYDQVLIGYDAAGYEIYDDVARVSISVDMRKWHKGKRFFFISNGGGAKFQMQARVGYELLKQVDRFLVEPDGTYTQVGSASEITISPTVNVDKTVNLPKSAKCLGYQFNVIDPFTTTQVYDFRNDTVNELPQSKYMYGGTSGVIAPMSCF